MNNEFKLFEMSLKQYNKSIFDKVNKGDLHTHALLGSCREIFSAKYPDIKLKDFKYNNGIISLSDFIKNNIINISTTRHGQLNLFECTILTAIKDGISILEMSVDYRLVFEIYKNNIRSYISDLRKLKNKYKNLLILKYDLGISRNAYKTSHKNIIMKLLASKTFDSIDIFGDELCNSIKVFKPIYRYAEKLNIKRKAHVGEFGTSKDIFDAIRILHLNVVQHGISIVDSLKIMSYAKKKGIQFNVCPISNLKLKRILDIKNHPIKKMYNFGLKVTINTDDQLVFCNSLFDEYFLLYSENVLSIKDLNNIRMNSIK